MNNLKVTSEITHGNLGLELLLRSIVNALGEVPLSGNLYVAISSSDDVYVEFEEKYNKKYADGSELVQTTIQAALDAASDGDIVLVKAKDMAAGATDPSSWEETLTIDAGKSGLKLIGLSNNITQGGLPQIKKGSGTTALLTVRAPGCHIANLGFNGVGAAPNFYQSLVGILLDDDASTKSAFGTTIENCHFKNCAGASASTNAAQGGAISWATGGGWQVRIKGCRFYKNVGDIVLINTNTSVPQDVIIEDCIFSGPAANVDCNLYLAGGSGMNGVIIRNNYFTAMPALGSVARFMDLTSCVGLLANNFFATITDPALSELTFASAGTGAKVPATVFMAGNQGEVQATANTSNHAAIGRYA